MQSSEINGHGLTVLISNTGLFEELDKRFVVQAIQDDSAVLSFLQDRPVGQSLPHQHLLTVEAADTLRRALVNKSIPFDETDPGIKLCYQMGWLHVDALGSTATEVVCVFPSSIHKK